MPTDKNKIVRSNRDILHLFPHAIGDNLLIKKDATLEDTMDLLCEKIPLVAEEETKLIARRLKGKDIYESCRNVWNFVYLYVKYVPDEKGKEQVKSPSRTLSDQAGDCDDMTHLIASILWCMGIKCTLRIAQYFYDAPGHYSHIYPVVKDKDQTIIVDCVENRFNYEEPYREIKDRNIMDLYYLNGIERPSTVDIDDLTNGGFDDLGKIKIFQKAKEAIKKVEQKIAPVIKKVGTAVQKTLNVVNKVNPATALLRLGILGSMKMNLFKVAENLRFGYLSDDEARKRGFNMDKFAKLKKALERTEGIFYTAGGKKENLREAILTGKGNASHEVSGPAYTYDTPIRDLIGEAVYDSEVSGLGSLGEPVTAAALAAASTIMATIKALLSQIGNLKGDGAANLTDTPVDPSSISPDDTITDDTVFTTSNDSNNTSDNSQVNTPANTDNGSNAEKTTNTALTTTTDNTGVTKSTGTGDNKTKDNPPTEKKWYQKPLVIGGIAVGTGLAVWGIIKLTRPKPKPSPTKPGNSKPDAQNEVLSGTWSHQGRKRNNKNKHRNHSGKNQIERIRWPKK